MGVRGDMKDTNVGFWLTLATLILVVIWCGYYIVARNINHKDMVFSYTALFAAMCLFLLNVYFSLRSESEVRHIMAHVYHKGNLVCFYKHSDEKQIPFFVAKNHNMISSLSNIPASQEVVGYSGIDARVALNKKLVEYMRSCFIGSLANDFYDWEKEPKGNVRGAAGYFISNDVDHKHEYLSHRDIIRCSGANISEGMLGDCNVAKWIKLPKGTKVKESKNGIIFDNPYCSIKIEFVVDINHVWDLKYNPDGTTYTICSVNPPCDRSITYFVNIIYTTEFKKELSGNPKKAICKAWSDKLFCFISDGFSWI